MRPLFAGQQVQAPERALDIVVIGASSSADPATWKDPAAPMPWLQQLVTDVGHKTQVWCHDYQVVNPKTKWYSDWIEEEQAFLGGIGELPPTPAGQRPPIIFICHGNGGLVLKFALARAAKYPQNFSSLFSAIRAIVFISTPHPKINDVETCDRLNMIARTFEVKLQKCIVSHDEITKKILPCMIEFERLGMLKCPIINVVEGSQTYLEYSGWFNKTKKEHRMLADYSLASINALNAKNITMTRPHMENCNLRRGDEVYLEITPLVK